MPIFLKLLTTTSAAIIPHDSEIQLHGISTDGLLILPAGIRVCLQFTPRTAFERYLLTACSKTRSEAGASMDIAPPGMTARSVRSSFNFALLVGHLQFLVQPSLVAHADLVDAKGPACGAVAALYSVCGSFRHESGCITGVLPRGKAALKPVQKKAT